jgi:hypothetical protein
MGSVGCGEGRSRRLRERAFVWKLTTRDSENMQLRATL